MKTKITISLLFSFLILLSNISFTPDLFAYAEGYEMLVTSRNTHSIKRFNGTTGEFIDDFIAAGAGGLNSVIDIDEAPDGNIIVSGRGNTSLLLFDKETGEFIKTFTSGYSLDNPTKIAYGPDGYIYVSQWGTVGREVVRFDGTTGEFIDVFTPPLDRPSDKTWDSNGNLYVACFGSQDVKKFDTDGNLIGVFTEAGHILGPTNLFFDGNGHLLVVDWNLGSVLRFDSETGAYIDVLISGFQNAEGFSIGPDGNIYICDWTLNHVKRFSPDGNLIDVFAAGGNMLAPNGIMFREVSSTSVNQNELEVASSFKLHQNYPNPFNPVTNINFEIAKRSEIKITVYNMNGKELETLFNGIKEAGSHTVTWNPLNSEADFSSGIYYLRLDDGIRFRNIKMTYLK
ncbi:MAG: T9SS type A sorting domain-containing protein [Ignavibacteriae bacterium]|nr:T9SS type A sorting domain-containing protein [Ignavibacteriota bacterium]